MHVNTCANVVALLNHALGEEASHRLIAAFGGQRIKIPTTLRGHVVETLGTEIVRVLAEAYGGDSIDIPSRGHAERIARSVKLRHDVLHSDLSCNEIAWKHGVTRIYVSRLRRNLGRPASADAPTSQPARKPAR